MKKAVLLHGTDGSPTLLWFPWLKALLENSGYEVFAPELPENHTPNRFVYNDFLFGSGWDFSDNVVIGHSSGAVSVLNLLMDKRCPKIKLGMMIGAWAGGKPERFEDDAQFENLFSPNGFDFTLIKRQAEQLVFLHGDDDPYCPLDQAKWLAEQTKSELTVIPHGAHLGSSRNPEFPELLELLQAQKLV